MTEAIGVVLLPTVCFSACTSLFMAGCCVSPPPLVVTFMVVAMYHCCCHLCHPGHPFALAVAATVIDARHIINVTPFSVSVVVGADQGV